MNTYTHLGLEERSEAVNSLPASPTAPREAADPADPPDALETDAEDETVVPKMVPSEAEWCPESCQSLAGRRTDVAPNGRMNSSITEAEKTAPDRIRTYNPRFRSLGPGFGIYLACQEIR